MTANFQNNDVFTSGNITSSGIITGTSGAFNNLTINGSSIVRSVVAGTGMSVSSSSGIYTINSIVATDSLQPNGFINRVDSVISMSGITFRIAPSGSFYDLYIRGTKVRKSGSESVTFANVTAQNYVYFRLSDYSLQYKTTDFDYSTDLPIAYVAWNSGVPPSGQATFFAEERHGIVMDNATHEWIHRTIGAQYVAGFSLDYYSTSGTGGLSGDATIGIGSGLLYQEDIKIDVTNSSSSLPFHQVISPTGQFPILYHSGTTGQWVKSTATNFPLLYNATGALYNLNTGGTWTTPNASTGATKYIAMWMLGTNEIDNPVMMILGQRVDGNQGNAESNNNWVDLNFSNLPVNEFKPLYRFIYATNTGWTNTPKSALVSVLDLRASAISSVVGVVQNDHGSLFGLNDDDHSQYIHNDISRTITAVHNFSNGITFGVSGTQTSAYVPTNVNITGGNINGVDINIPDFGLSYFATDDTLNNVINNIDGAFDSTYIYNSINYQTVLTNPVTSAPGSANYLPLFNSSTTIGNSIIYQTANRIAINATVPNATLHVTGSGFFSSGLRIGSTLGTGSNINTISTAYGLGMHHSGLMITTPESTSDNIIHNSVRLLVSKPANSNGGQTSIDFASRDRGNAVDNGVMAQVIGGNQSGTTNGNGGQLILSVAPSGSSTATPRLIINNNGNIGIGTNSPNAPLHIVGNTNISGVLTATSGSITTLNTVPTFTSPSALGSSQGDWNPGAGDVIRASASVSGVAISGIFLGNEYTRVLINVGTTNNLTLKHQASTATSGYRIITPNGGDYIVQPTGAATILYDIIDNRWRVL